MEANEPCPFHQGKQLKFICLDKVCQMPKLYCEECLPQHEKHTNMKINSYKKIYQDFQALNYKNFIQIKTAFQNIKIMTEECLKNMEKKILQQFCLNYSPEAFPDLKSVEIQQFYGITESTFKNPIFSKLLLGKSLADTTFQFEQSRKTLMKDLAVFENQMIEKINSFTQMPMPLKKPQIFSQLFEEKIDKNYFLFSKIMKSSLLLVHNDGKTLGRSSVDRGLSVYGIVDKPLTKENSSIAFQLNHQLHRFIYFGVCNPEKFSLFDYRGPVYEKGNGMYALRQNSIEGKSAFSLHNSHQFYSNVENVGWDFRAGDKLKIQYVQEKHMIIFSCNDVNRFEMPLDSEITKVYPFVGIKFEEKISILSQDECNRNYQMPKNSHLKRVNPFDPFK